MIQAHKMKDILVDADALVALAKIDDSNHKKATKISNSLQKAGINYFLSPFTVAECSTVLSYKVSHKVAKEFLKEMKKIDLPILELEGGNDLVDLWFIKQTKKGTSYFDCYNLALLDRFRKQIVGIFSFDSIYQRNGFKLAKDLKL